jgi:uncharacterized membrane protein YsdA (DUF1294 family)
MDPILQALSAFFVFMNLLAVLVMYIDKRKSRKEESERVSEGLLFFLATVFGSVGVFFGMFTFRHKTRKWYFLLGIPLLFLENMALLYVIYLLLRTS